MKDRNVEFPNRYRLTKVAGTDDVYDLIPAPGEVYEEGTFRNKANDLSDQTLELLGYAAEQFSEITQDMVFKLLGRLNAGLGNEYVWAKTTNTEGYLMQLSETKTGSNWNVFTNFFYADDISLDVATGDLTFVNAQPLPTNAADAASVIVGKYVYHTTDTTYQRYIVSATASSGNVSTTYQLVSVKYFSETDVVGYVNSRDPNAYPPAEDDGYTYTALGQLGAKVQIATGSYTGTGTYGSANPNSLTFDFAPKILIISKENGSYGYGSIDSNITLFNGTQEFTIMINGSGSVINRCTWGKTVSWYYYYGSNATGQEQIGSLNQKNQVYRYIAIG